MPKVLQGFSAQTTGIERPVRPEVGRIYEAVMSVEGDTDAESWTLRTPLPQNYSFSLSSEYNNPYNQPISEIAGGGNARLAESALTLASGHTSQNKWLSAATWSGGSEFAIEIPFVLQAYTDPVKEVLIPMKRLLKLAAAGESILGSLTSPGPLPNVVGERDFRGTVITIEIGKFFKMTPCIVTSVTEDFDTQMDEFGSPIGAVVRVQFKSFWTCTKNDLDDYFLPSIGNNK
jgi:hypothetical protein